MYNLTSTAAIELSLDLANVDASPIISTPCDETLPEWMTIAGTVAVLYTGLAFISLTAVGWFAAGMPSLTPELRRMVEVAARHMGCSGSQNIEREEISNDPAFAT